MVELFRRHALDGAFRSNGHEYRRPDGPVGQKHGGGTGTARSSVDVELQCGRCWSAIVHGIFRVFSHDHAR